LRWCGHRIADGKKERNFIWAVVDLDLVPESLIAEECACPGNSTPS